MNQQIEVVDEITKEDEQTIFHGLLEYNLARLEDKNPKDLGVYFRNDKNVIIAGLTAVTHGKWLSIKFLWVDESLRGQHMGEQLLKSAEQEAIKRGCQYAFVDTFDFQAPEFYTKYGYQEQFALENYPVTGKRFYYTKVLV